MVSYFHCLQHRQYSMTIIDSRVAAAMYDAIVHAVISLLFTGVINFEWSSLDLGKCEVLSPPMSK